MSERLRIALTKGRLQDKSVELFEAMGLDCSPVRNPGRRLIHALPNYPLDAVLAKAPDVITYVEHGVCDLGVVGKDTILEKGGAFYEVLDLGFGRCRFALAVKKGSDFYGTYKTRRIASKYPNVTRAFFEGKGMDVDIIKIEGSVELAPILDLADGIVDIVETGATLKENGLEPIEDVAQVSARLIVNTASMKLYKNEITDFLSRVERELGGKGMITIIKADGFAERRQLDAMRSRAAEKNADIELAVKAIMEAVRQEGLPAVERYSRQFDHKVPYELSAERLDEAYAACPAGLIAALEHAARNIRDYNEKLLAKSEEWTSPDGGRVGRVVRGLTRVGIYVPGGTAAYPSSVLMNAVPAKVAGVEEIVMITPPTENLSDAVLAAAKIAGVDRVIAVGGAQAVAAVTYGAGFIPRVDKLVGPGNAYVAAAKRLAYGQLDIDMVAGPSEVLVIADGSANPKYVAADLLSQAEHDKLASAVLLTGSAELAQAVDAEIVRQTGYLSRSEIMETSLRDFGCAIVCENLDQCVELANEIAPEHLEIVTENPRELLPQIKNAGAVFLGAYTPEPLGDYLAGPDHVLPTSGTARFFSPLSVDSFLKTMSVLEFDRVSLEPISQEIIALAQAEKLTAHANSIQVRFE